MTLIGSIPGLSILTLHVICICLSKHPLFRYWSLKLTFLLRKKENSEGVTLKHSVMTKDKKIYFKTA